MVGRLSGQSPAPGVQSPRKCTHDDFVMETETSSMRTKPRRAYLMNFQCHRRPLLRTLGVTEV